VLVGCVTFGYDNNHRRTSTNFPGGGSETIVRDNSGRPKTITTAGPGTGGPFPTRNYCWGANNDCGPNPSAANDRSVVQSVTDQTGATISFIYDTSNRLTQANNTAGSNDTLTYDSDGNMTQSVVGGTTTNYAYNAANQLCWTSASTGDCTNPPTTRTNYTLDPNGSLIGAGTNSFSYNTKDEMKQSIVGSTTNNYAYADIDQTERTSGPGPNSSQDTAPLRLMRFGSVYYTRDNNGVPIARRDTTGTKYYLADLTGNIMGMADAFGNLVNSYTYNEYGTLSSSTGTNNELKFAGGFQDSSTGFYHFGARYYDPAAGRWTQQDPIPGTLANTKTIDRYTYAGDNPTTNIDPSGRDWLSAGLGVIGVIATIGGAFAGVDEAAVAVFFAFSVTTYIIATACTYINGFCV
jgi:RHS repeat-associated protein